MKLVHIVVGVGLHRPDGRRRRVGRVVLVPGPPERVVLAPAARWPGRDRRLRRPSAASSSSRAARTTSLHLIYGLLPLGISFVAEQLRIASAQVVLDSRGFESAAAVGRLPESEQRVVVVAIVQRELGVMVLAALVMLVLLVRAAGTGG